MHLFIPATYLLFASTPKLSNLMTTPSPFGHLRLGLENLWALSNINSLIYCIAALRLLNKVKRLVNFYYADINSSDLNWLKNFLYGTILLIGIDVSITFYEVILGDIDSAIGIIAIFVVFLIVYLAYKGISQTRVLLPAFLLQETNHLQDTKKENNSRPISKNHKFDTQELSLIQTRLQHLFRQTKLYLNPELSLRLVAKELDISEKKLSYLLNQHMGVSFYDYVNALRIEEVKQKIQDPSYDQYTLLAIALECGFNSKTSFNRTFNRFEGVTPSKYRKVNVIEKQVS